MNETQYVTEMRRQAVRRLPAGFPNQVVRDARARQRRSQRNQLTVITTAICVAIAIAAHWALTAQTDRANLELWSKAAIQITALEEAI